MPRVVIRPTITAMRVDTRYSLQEDGGWRVVDRTAIAVEETSLQGAIVPSPLDLVGQRARPRSCLAVACAGDGRQKQAVGRWGRAKEVENKRLFLLLNNKVTVIRVEVGIDLRISSATRKTHHHQISRGVNSIR